MKHRTIIILVFFLAATIFFIYRFLSQPDKDEYLFYPMGGIPCSLVEYDADSKKFLGDARSVESRVDQLEDVFNIYRPGSEAARLNDSRPDEWYPLSSDMYRVMEKSLIWYGKSGGAFDITVAPLVRLWKAAAKKGVVPAKTGIDSTLVRVGSSKITLSPDKGIEFSAGGMELDFGGIAKGYIVDQVGRWLKENGVEQFVFTCGGHVFMSGKENFRVGIQEPGGGEGDLMMVMNSSPGGVVTSGHYERFSEIGGRRYSHIIDPVTGMPVDNSLVSVTIVADNATDADALATAVAVLGLERSVGLLKGLKGFEAVLLEKIGGGFRVHYSRSLADRLEYEGEWASIPRVEF